MVTCFIYFFASASNHHQCIEKAIFWERNAPNFDSSWKLFRFLKIVSVFFLARNTYLISVRVHLPTKSYVWFFFCISIECACIFDDLLQVELLLCIIQPQLSVFALKNIPFLISSYSNRTHLRVEKVQVPNVKELQLQNCIEEREKERKN